jgi:hypothetical protein
LKSFSLYAIGEILNLVKIWQFCKPDLLFVEPPIFNFRATPYVYISAMDNILTAMTEKRLFERFAFKLPTKPTKEKASIQTKDFNQWLFDSARSDYINLEDWNETLFGYELTNELRDILINNIDLEMQ